MQCPVCSRYRHGHRPHHRPLPLPSIGTSQQAGFTDLLPSVRLEQGAEQGPVQDPVWEQLTKSSTSRGMTVGAVYACVQMSLCRERAWPKMGSAFRGLGLFLKEFKVFTEV